MAPWNQSIFFKMPIRTLSLLNLSAILITSMAFATLGLAQSPAPSANPSPVASPTPPSAAAVAARKAAAADRRRMLAKIGIADPLNLPPGNPMAKPGHKTNTTDESAANPFPLTDPLRMANGKQVTDATTWWTQRRPEIAEAFASQIYGRIPKDAPNVTWATKIYLAANVVPGAIPVTGSNGAMHAAIEPTQTSGSVVANVTYAIGRVDNSTWPAANAEIDLALFLPADAKGPVPVIVEVTSGGAGGLRTPVALNEILAKGWGCAVASTYTVQPDSGSGFKDGVIGIVNKGAARKPDQWGALTAWSWGLSRVIDYLQTLPAVDAKRLGIEGHSRWGKTALLAAALDPRWSIVYASCSGEGGAKPSRRDWGETLDDVAGIAEYHWMAGNFLKYAKHWDQLPVDSPDLIAMVAPRPVFIGCGTKDQWADPHGQFLALQAAGPVWKILGKQDLGVTAQPGPDQAVIDGDQGYRMHEGGHTDTLDFPTFLTFAEKYWK
jgi:dienelactone hydrolase